MIPQREFPQRRRPRPQLRNQVGRLDQMRQTGRQETRQTPLRHRLPSRAGTLRRPRRETPGTVGQRLPQPLWPRHCRRHERRPPPALGTQLRYQSVVVVVPDFWGCAHNYAAIMRLIRICLLTKFIVHILHLIQDNACTDSRVVPRRHRRNHAA